LAASLVFEYRTNYNPSWCPGCGDFGILKALDMAFHELELPPEQVVVLSGIGCNGRFPHNFKTYGFHTLHGRVLPVAQGISIANPTLSIVGVVGDGDALSIGGGHLPHAARRNPDMTYIVFDNGIYAQTKGQPSPTTPAGFKTKVTPAGYQEDPLDLCQISLAYGVSFLGRGFTGKTSHLAHLIAEGIKHKGFALIQVLNPCPTFHDTWKEYPTKVVEIGAEHDARNYESAWKLLRNSGDHIPIGIIFRQEKKTIHERLAVTGPRVDLKSMLASFR